MVCRVFQINQESVSWEGTRLSAPWQVDLPRIAFSAVTYYIIARSAHACDWFLPSLSNSIRTGRFPSRCVSRTWGWWGSIKLIELSLRLLLLPKTRTRLICWKPVCLGTLFNGHTCLELILPLFRALPSFLPLTTENTTSNSKGYFLDVSNKWFYTFILPVFPR